MRCRGVVRCGCLSSHSGKEGEGGGGGRAGRVRRNGFGRIQPRPRGACQVRAHRLPRILKSVLRVRVRARGDSASFRQFWLNFSCALLRPRRRGQDLDGGARGSKDRGARRGKGAGSFASLRSPVILTEWMAASNALALVGRQLLVSESFPPLCPLRRLRPHLLPLRAVSDRWRASLRRFRYSSASPYAAIALR